MSFVLNVCHAVPQHQKKKRMSRHAEDSNFVPTRIQVDIGGGESIGYDILVDQDTGLDVDETTGNLHMREETERRVREVYAVGKDSMKDELERYNRWIAQPGNKEKEAKLFDNSNSAAARQPSSLPSTAAASKSDPKSKWDEKAALAKKERGNEALSRGDHRIAVARYTEGIALHPQLVVLWANRSEANLRLERYSAAFQDAAEALRLDPTHEKSAFRRVSALMGLGQIEDAAMSIERAITAFPSSAAVWGKKLVELRSLRKVSVSGNTVRVVGSHEAAGKHLGQVGPIAFTVPAQGAVDGVANESDHSVVRRLVKTYLECRSDEAVYVAFAAAFSQDSGPPTMAVSPQAVQWAAEARELIGDSWKSTVSAAAAAEDDADVAAAVPSSADIELRTTMVAELLTVFDLCYRGAVVRSADRCRLILCPSLVLLLSVGTEGQQQAAGSSGGAGWNPNPAAAASNVMVSVSDKDNVSIRTSTAVVHGDVLSASVEDAAVWLPRSAEPQPRSNILLGL